MANIIIRGYYGFGNLGDDVLMLVTFRWLKENFPESSISICTDADSPEYISSLLGEDVSIFKSNQRIKADWIIHGGGGVFFDFNESGIKYKLLNSLIKTIGYSTYSWMYDQYQTLRGTKGVSSKNRAGIGIGIGTYTTSSKRFYADILSLSALNFLLVRDNGSVENIKKLNLQVPVHVASDLAFLHRFWNLNSSVHKESGNLQIGFVLRDWVYDNHDYLHEIELVTEQLKQQGYKIKFYSFDARADTQCLQRFSSGFSFSIWDPANLLLNDFLRDLSSNNLIVTSRAHGAILSACLGVPSVCLGIEPKLREISGMLKRSTRLVEKPLTRESIQAAIHDCIENLKGLEKAIKLDVDENFMAMNRGLQKFKDFMESN